MNVVYQGLGLLLLVTGALSAAITTLGGKCTIGVDSCSVNGAVCDKASLTCVCQFGYVQSGAICSRPAMGLCGAGMCKNWQTMTCDANQCKCDASKGYIASGADCVCDTAKFFSVKTGGCIGNSGAACTADSDCVTGMKCTSSKCTCDPALHYAAAIDGASTCACDTGYSLSSGICCATGFAAESNGVCKKVWGQPCAAGDCLSTLTCDTTCKCDTTTKKYGAGGAGDKICSCPLNTAMDSTTGTCKKVWGEACGTGECLSTLSCATTCKCDATLHYATGKTGDTKCVGKVGAACSVASDCVTGMVCTSSKCACNTTLNYAAGVADETTCNCASGYGDSSGLCCPTGKTNYNGICCTTGESNSNGICCAAGSIESNGACKKVWGQTCSAAGDCLSTLICATTCKCDTTKNYAAGSAGATTCACNSATFFTDKTGGGCIGKVGAACTAASDCLTGLVCTSSKCACDTTKNFVAGTDGAASCGCTTGYTYSSFYGKCAINVGGACTRDSTYAPCVDNAVCDRATDTCKCDSVAGYMVAGTTCSTTTCISGYTMVNGRCVADLNGACIPSTQSGVCVGGATCFAGNSTSVPQCLCDSGQYDYKFSCSGAGGVVASLACLLMALFMTSRLM